MDEHSHQTHLGPSPNNTLAIVDVELLRSQPQSVDPAVPNFIFRLPDELLVNIVELAVFEPYCTTGCFDCRSKPNAEYSKALSRVCRRLGGIAQPMLFHTIRFDGTPSMAPPKKRVIRLYRILQQKPSLRQHCKRLSISISDIPEITETEDFAIVNDFAEWFTNVRCLENYGGWGSQFSRTQTWAVIRKMTQNMPYVRHWSLSREGFGLYSWQVMKETAFPNLARLDLHGISELKHSFSQVKQNAAKDKSTKILRTAPFTSLSISDYEETPGATNVLIQWPSQLQNFQFCSFYNNPFTMTYPMFQSWLSIHRETLRSIELGYLSGYSSNDKHIFDATCFPNLELLELSRWQMGRSGELQPFTAENAALLAPKLKLFRWSFSIYDQHSESWEDFGEKEEAWLRGLGEAVIARKSPLKTVEIKFRPDDWSSEEKEEYPWSRMDRVRDEVFQPNGSDIIYGTPCISQETWLANREKWIASGRIHAWEMFSENITETEDSSKPEEVAEKQPTREYHGRNIREYFHPL